MMLEDRKLLVYSSLKQKVIQLIGKTNDLEKLKSFFKSHIDSPRAYRQIKSVEDLIVILEHRDVLNCEYPMALFFMGEILNIDEIKDLVLTCKKIYLGNKPSLCRCGIERDCRPEANDCSKPEGNICKKRSPKSDIMEAIKIVAEEIVKVADWRVLTSELDIKECIIDEIYKKYPKDKKMQVEEALKHWVNRENENATFAKLDKALNSRHCKRNGIGSHIRFPQKL